MNAQRPVPKANASERPLRTKRQDNSSYERRTLEKSISDDNLLALVEDYFRTHTIGLLHSNDRVIKGWIGLDDDEHITVKYIVEGPPMKIKKKKGVKITVINA